MFYGFYMLYHFTGPCKNVWFFGNRKNLTVDCSQPTLELIIKAMTAVTLFFLLIIVVNQHASMQEQFHKVSIRIKKLNFRHLKCNSTTMNTANNNNNTSYVGEKNWFTVKRKPHRQIWAGCTHLTKWLTKCLTIWLAVDALLATLILG